MNTPLSRGTSPAVPQRLPQGLAEPTPRGWETAGGSEAGKRTARVPSPRDAHKHLNGFCPFWGLGRRETQRLTDHGLHLGRRSERAPGEHRPPAPRAWPGRSAAAQGKGGGEEPSNCVHRWGGARRAHTAAWTRPEAMPHSPCAPKPRGPRRRNPRIRRENQVSRRLWGFRLRDDGPSPGAVPVRPSPGRTGPVGSAARLHTLPGETPTGQE